MSQKNLFVEFHVLRSHAPGNLNRDDLGTPKTASFGGHRRLRLSSQCVKRTWRMSELFRDAVTEGDKDVAGRLLSERTSLLPESFARELKAAGLTDAQVDDAIEVIARIGVKSKKDEADGADEEEEGDDADEGAEAGEAAEVGVRETRHLLFISAGDREALRDYFVSHTDALAALFKTKTKGKGAKAEVLRTLDAKEHEKFRKSLAQHMEKKWTGVDIALFGRFVTSAEIPTVNAALQVAHALGTQRVEIESDYFSAVDDVKQTSGAGHIGETEFAASVLYQYACCDWRLLCENLHGDRTVAARALSAIARAATRSVPRGKVNGTAPHNPADYLEVVVRRNAPVSLANAFLKPVRPQGDDDVMDGSVKALRTLSGTYAAHYDDPHDVVDRFVLSTRPLPKGPSTTEASSLADLEAKLIATLREHGAST
jgi:CRISPR system Cascade subunit CasC